MVLRLSRVVNVSVELDQMRLFPEKSTATNCFMRLSNKENKHRKLTFMNLILNNGLISREKCAIVCVCH